MGELFAMQFFRNAFFMSVVLSVLFGVLSFFVVLRKMSFLGAGISHTAFGGVALGVFLGIDPFFTSMAFCVSAAVLMGRLVRHGKFTYDAGMGIFFSVSMALGAIMLSLKKDYTFDMSGYLFGNILGVTAADNWIAAAALCLVLPFVVLFLHRILFMILDEEVASVSGVKTAAIDTVMLVFLAAIIVVSMKIVGIILMSALIVLPASFGLLLSKNFRAVLVIGVAYALAVMIGGLFLSYWLDTPTGATMVVSGTAVYFAVMGARRALRP